ncbi:hypothetical protein JCM8547_002043 [Rhodosporidiobolus lusitaniae]
MPTELIEQILSELEADKYTVARCCRLCKAFRRYSEALLYKRIDVQLVDVQLWQALGNGDIDEEVDETREFWYSRSTLALVNCLMSSRKSDLVREVHSSIKHVGDHEEGMYTTPKIAFATVLCALPNLDSLNVFFECESECFEWLKAKWSQMTERAHASRIDLGILDETSCDVLEQLQHEIQHLGFSSYGGDLKEVPSVDLDSLPLRSFKFVCKESRGSRARYRKTQDLLLASSHQTLSSLTISTALIHDVSVFVHLRHLDITQVRKGHCNALRACLKSAASLPSLASLTLLDNDSSLYPSFKEHCLSLEELVTTRPSQLRQFRLREQSLHPDEVVKFLEHLPSSSSLSLFRFSPMGDSHMYFSRDPPSPPPDYGPAHEAAR